MRMSSLKTLEVIPVMKPATTISPLSKVKAKRLFSGSKNECQSPYLTPLIEGNEVDQGTGSDDSDVQAGEC